jgi:hypothetical protein
MGPGPTWKPCGDVVLFQAGGVEPFFEDFGPSAVTKSVAIPDASQRSDFIEAGASAGLEGERGVGADDHVQCFLISEDLRES